jgi:hypothetical protein
MVCYISCGITIIFLIGMVYMNTSVYKKAIITKYYNNLSDDAKEAYENIVNERMQIYNKGFVLGFFVSLLFLYYNKYVKQEKLTVYQTGCIVLSVMFVVNFFYYILSPKSDWMLNHVSSKRDVKNWLKLYKYMQRYYYSGLLLGLIAVVSLNMAFKC